MYHSKDQKKSLRWEGRVGAAEASLVLVDQSLRDSRQLHHAEVFMAVLSVEA
jgi:hypothetical protein